MEAKAKADELRRLIVRFNTLGEMLPSEEDVTLEQESRDTAKVVLAEMEELNAKIWELLDGAAPRNN